MTYRLDVGGLVILQQGDGTISRVNNAAEMCQNGRDWWCQAPSHADVTARHP